MKSPIVAVFWLSVSVSVAGAINLSITTGAAGWTVVVPGANMPTVPGADISVSTYTSGAAQTVMRVRRLPGGWMPGSTGWYITARKVDTNWHPNLRLYIRCTAPTTGWNYRLSAYGELTDADLLIVRRASQTQVAGISMQFQLTGVSAIVGTSNTTTVVYTLTEY